MIDGTCLWFCFQYRGDKPWEIQGVFDSEEKAVAACKNDNFGVAPIKLNHELPVGTVKLEGAYYPSEREQK